MTPLAIALIVLVAMFLLGLPIFMSVPATTKQGMASSGNRFRPSKSELWMTDRGRMSPPARIATTEEMIRDMKIGSPSRNMATRITLRRRLLPEAPSAS